MVADDAIIPGKNPFEEDKDQMELDEDEDQEKQDQLEAFVIITFFSSTQHFFNFLQPS